MVMNFYCQQVNMLRTILMFQVLLHFEGIDIMHKRFFSSHNEQDAVESIPQIIEFPLPQPGEGIKECELLKWLVQEGDPVEEFQPLCVVQSDKASIEITSPHKGIISRLRFSPGDMITIGETLLEIQTDDGNIPPSTNVSNDKESNADIKKSLATPAVRQMAKEYGLSVDDIAGSGKDGRVSKEDVLKYAQGRDSRVASTVTEQTCDDHKPRESLVHHDKVISLRGFQRAMVKTMSMAAKVPHFHYLEEVNVDSLIKLKSSFQVATDGEDLKHSYLPFLIKSLSFTLMEHESMNSVFNEEAYELICKGSHNIGVAMATGHGLVVPNIKNVQSLSILQITKELQRLIEAASYNKLSTEDTTGGTITISNIGAIGGRFGSPLVNLPEVVIVALGRIQKLPRFDADGNIYPASLMNITFGADHRVIDGAAVARFSNRWKLLIENPEHLLFHLK
eukprot:TRINITY_DN5185_c0_g1_i6.p1 TRINITY_DN5185_c0_g1~~TRINITY_DN5185_c0_g1_i6.p1  ORF type:complete len:450 (-),score=94.15 TRINITY_DN5185_c0_g1_i6:188-1537(-)